MMVVQLTFFKTDATIVQAQFVTHTHKKKTTERKKVRIYVVIYTYLANSAHTLTKKILNW